jgi:hypothetical protein
MTEYVHETHGTARATIKLPSGPIEILAVTSPDEFATDREITQAEYETIRGCLRQMVDCALMASNPRGLVAK